MAHSSMPVVQYQLRGVIAVEYIGSMPLSRMLSMFREGVTCQSFTLSPVTVAVSVLSIGSAVVDYVAAVRRGNVNLWFS